MEFDDEFNKISTAINDIEEDVQTILLTGFPEPPESDANDPKVYARTYYDDDPGDDFPAQGDWVEAPTFAEFSALKNQVNDLPLKDHIHQIDDIEGLEDALANAGEVEEAPKDGVQYARQDAAWTPLEIPELDYTLPVALRSGVVQLPLTVDGKKLAVMTRGGELQLPLAA